MVRFVISQCIVTSVVVFLCLGGGSDATKDQRWTEQEKQTAFQQLLSGAGRLRLEASSSDGAIVQPSSAAELSTSAIFNDEESKRHDRRQAIDISGKENSKKKKKEEKKEHQKGHRQHHHGRHVCTHEETVTRPVRVVETYCKPTYKSQTQKCTNGTSLCTAFRVQYDTLYRTVIKYTTTVEKKNACCPGWIQKHQKANQGCLQALCNPGCLNGGSCIRPNVCSCPVGYTGPTCETDVDECATRASNKCHQNCVNTIGSYECSCYEGFQLQDDRKSCKFQLELVPELQTLLANYEAMSKRIAILEQESKERALQQTPSLPAITMDAIEFEATVSNMTQHILTIEDKLNKLTETSMLTSRYNSIIEPDNDSLSSISEQLGILEERLADCTCTPTLDNNRVKPRS